MSGTSPRAPSSRRRLHRRAAYLLPSLFTLGNIFLGFFAIVSGLDGRFERTAILIFAAALLDAFDGRIARMTGTESDFGREYDSLADLVTFGVAPAIVAYTWGLEPLGRLGWLVPLFFLVCAATRLARFNVKTKVVDARFFVGLPVPAAAGAVGAFFLSAPDHAVSQVLPVALLFLLGIVGVLMVSTFRYLSFKQLDFRRPWSYRIVLPLAALLLVAASQPEGFFITVATIYALSGPLWWVVGRLRGGRGRSAGADEQESSQS